MYMFIDVFWLFLAFFAGVGLKIVWDWQIKRKALSIVRTKASQKAVKDKADQGEELMAMIAEAGAAFKSAREQGEDMKQAAQRILPALAAKYPLVIAKYGKKLMGALGPIDGFF
jgi:hypothetical protein